MKTYIRTFRSDNTKIHDVELFGGQDDTRVVLFCARRAVACNGYAVVITQDTALPNAIANAFLDGYIGALQYGQGGAPINKRCTVGAGWVQVLVYSEGAGERASELPYDDVEADAWELVQYVDYCENLADFYEEDVNSCDDERLDNESFYVEL